jgi:8-oxo-dGTP pyrophosphatase MutT (NUDIX family)
MSNAPTINIFSYEPELVRGSASLPHAPHKKYAYVEHPTDGWRVYLRSVSFLRDLNADPASPDYNNFVVVKATHKRANTTAWEPPKGQMEGKDMLQEGPLIDSLLINAYREVVEESGIPLDDFAINHSGFIYQSREKDYPPNHFFQYHVFIGEVDSDGILQYNDQIRLKGVNYALQRFHYYKSHPDKFNALRKDYKEKDGITWFDPVETKLFGRWSPDIVMMYLNKMQYMPRVPIQVAVANKNRLYTIIQGGL